MIDLERLSQLYDTAHDQTKTIEQRKKAVDLLASIDADQLVTAYLERPENIHQDTFQWGNVGWKTGDRICADFHDLAHQSGIRVEIPDHMRACQQIETAFCEGASQRKIEVVIRHWQHENAKVAAKDRQCEPLELCPCDMCREEPSALRKAILEGSL